MDKIKHADLIRDWARKHCIEPARLRGDATVQIVAGEVQKAVSLHNRTPLVCQALRSRKFLEENHLALERWDGPPSGTSTTVKFTFRFLNEPAQPGRVGESPLYGLWGIGKEVFQSLGGAEAFLRSERKAWEGEENS